MIFSKYFKIPEENFGFLDINLNGDYPFFIDPLLLDNNKELPNAYERFLSYFKNEDASFIFKEVKQTHLGFSYQSNSGRGISKNMGEKLKGNHFMQAYEFDLDTIDIFVEGIGVDLISDMTTNIILEDLCEYTRMICYQYDIPTEKVALDNGTVKLIKSELPVYNNDCIILVPKSILRKDRLLLSKENFVDNMFDVVQTVDNDLTRSRLNDLLHKKVYVKCRKKYETKKIPKKDIRNLINKIIEIEPQVVSIFKSHMRTSDGLTNVTSQDYEIHTQSIQVIERLTNLLESELLSTINQDITLIEKVRNLILYYKNEIENTDFIKIFNESSMQDEKQHQRIFRTISKIKDIGLNAEVNNGNGPVDFKFTKTNESILVEFKLARASNVSNIYNQIEKYFNSNQDAKFGFAVIIAYNEEEMNKISKVIELNLNENIETIVINCDVQKYKSASKSKEKNEQITFRE